MTRAEWGEATMVTTDQDRNRPRSGRAQPASEGRMGLIVAASLATGVIAALVLVAAPFIPAKENILTGVVLLGCALG